MKLEAAKQEESAQRTGHGGELLQNRRYAEAEEEYRAAIKLDPQNAYLHIALSRDLTFEKKTDEASQEARLAIGLNPDNEIATFAWPTPCGFRRIGPGRRPNIMKPCA